MWVEPGDDPRAVDEQAVGEKAVLASYLRHYRLTLEMKCEGLGLDELARRSIPPSTMSLLGLIRHMAGVEHHWFQRVLQGKDEPRLYRADDDPDLDFNGAAPDPVVVVDAWATWRREVASAEAWFDQVESLDERVEVDGDPVEVRDILVHMIEEYARHAGHADLLRECIDGRTGQ